MLQSAANQYLNDANYAYSELVTYLLNKVSVTTNVTDQGADAIAVSWGGARKDRALIVRRLQSVVSKERVPPEVVIRASALQAAQLG